MKNINYRFVALRVVSILTGACLPLMQAHSSGSYIHIFSADTAIVKIGNNEIQGILENRRELFKFSSLFMDTYNYCDDCDDPGGTASFIHQTPFLDQYAQAIRDECFLSPVGTDSCSKRKDIVCEQFTLRNCDVPGGRVCTIEESGALKSCATDILNPINGNCPQFDGKQNPCADRGVCNNDYTTPCAQSENFGIDSPQCSNGSRCVDNYGFCQTNFDAKCERLVTHFMGALAHLVTDINNDKFLVRTVFERNDCPGRDYGDETTSDTNPAQIYTDQEMDGYLGRAEYTDDYDEYDPGGIAKWVPLHDYLPSLLVPVGRQQVEDKFVEDEVLAKLLGVKEASEVTSALNNQYFFGMPNKVDKDGTITQTFLCAKGRNLPDSETLKCADRNLIENYGIECLPIDKESCNVRECSEDKGNGKPTLCRSDTECPGETNTCEDSDTAGVCTAGPEGEYVTPCRQDSDCVGILGGIFNTCSMDYGSCKISPIRRETCHDECKWALEDGHWYTEAGGADDTAREIAKMIDQTWLMMRRGAIPKFRRVGKFPDTHLCVGTSTNDCLQDKSLKIIGPPP